MEGGAPRRQTKGIDYGLAGARPSMEMSRLEGGVRSSFSISLEKLNVLAPRPSAESNNMNFQLPRPIAGERHNMNFQLPAPPRRATMNFQLPSPHRGGDTI
jgi:hypothetical protein